MLDVRSAFEFPVWVESGRLDYSAIQVLRLFRHKASHSAFTVEAENNQSKLEKSQNSQLWMQVTKKTLLRHKGIALIYVRSHVRHY